jgi:hypothetical protein
VAEKREMEEKIAALTKKSSGVDENYFWHCIISKVRK